MKKLLLIFLLLKLGLVYGQVQHRELYSWQKKKFEQIEQKILRFGIDNPEKVFLNDSLRTPYTTESLFNRRLKHAFDTVVSEKELFGRFVSEQKIYGMRVSMKYSGELNAPNTTKIIEGCALLYHHRLKKRDLAEASMFWVSLAQLKSFLSAEELQFFYIWSNSASGPYEFEQNESEIIDAYNTRIFSGKSIVKIDSSVLMLISMVQFDLITDALAKHVTKFTSSSKTGVYKDSLLKTQFNPRELEEHLTRKFRFNHDTIFYEEFMDLYHFIHFRKSGEGVIEFKSDDEEELKEVKTIYVSLRELQEQLPRWMWLIVEEHCENR